MLYTVVDIESTGYSGTNCDVIQFAYAQLDENFNIVECGKLHYYYPGMSWSDQAERESHHISKEYLKQFAAEFEDNIRKMYVVLNRSNVVGHNSDKFDIPFIQQWLQRFGFPLLTFNRTIDTMKILRPVVKKRVASSDAKFVQIGDYGPASCALPVLPKKFGIPESYIEMCEEMYWGSVTHQHSASYDVMATITLLTKARQEGVL